MAQYRGLDDITQQLILYGGSSSDTGLTVRIMSSAEATCVQDLTD